MCNQGLLKAGFIGVLALCSTSAFAATDNACWNRDVERLDYAIDPPEHGDQRFFTTVSNTSDNTNVVMLYPDKASLKDFTQRLYRIKVDLGGTGPAGCTNAYLNTMTYFMPSDVTPPAGASALQGRYSSLKTYPDPGPTYSGGAGQSDGLSSGSAYRYLNWPANGGGTAETVATACTTAGGLAQTLACQVCVTTNGYWLNPAVADNDVSTSAGVFSTNYLRFHPPKWTMLSLAYKRLINGPLLSVLREAVVAQNDATGGITVQKMLPQSCSGQGRPTNQKQGAIDGLRYTSTANPLAEMLFNTGWYMGGQASPWLFTNAATQGGAAMANGRSGPCNSCNGDFVVLFSDGRGDTANPACTKVGGVLPPQCTAAALCGTLGLGEADGDDFLDPGLAGGAKARITGPSARLQPGGTCDMDFADDVARFMHNNDMSPTSPSKISVYVVGIGDPNNTYGEMSTLEEIASQGGGQYLAADDFASLEQNIEQVLTTIITRATSFSAAAITTVQTQDYVSTFVPRFRPSDGSSWEGNLSRFDLFNEFSAGCTPADYGSKTVKNPNGNRSCFDLYLTDANHDFIGEDSNGSFVLLDSSKPFDGGWPIMVSDAGTGFPAAPIWEASAQLTTRVQTLISGGAETQRNIYTVGPDGSGGYSPTLVPFTPANVAAVTPWLKLGGATGDTCSTLSAKTRHIYATENDCALDVINFMHGRDVLMQNPYNRTVPAPAVLKPRPNVLGDIFHSVPVLVTPPSQTGLCELGIANQCVASLFSSTLTPNGATAYTSYVNTNQYRSQFVLVGSNDGMVHAFNAANDTIVDGGTHTYDLGTGRELWAFVPPDMLPKLIRYMIGERHELLVDGAPMVRDVWVDGTGSSATVDRVKQADEFHTIAVIAEREGGRSYLALDVTNPVTPGFKWLWPPPGTTEALINGEAWNDLGPSAAPVGPIAEYDSAGPFAVNGVRARERYVVAVGGGYDPAFLRGHAVYMLDAWTGAQVYRFARQDASGASDPRNKLYPVAAPVTMFDGNSDGLFDTAVVGDTGGQVWTLGIQAPGRDTNGDGRYDNWFGARAFIQFKGQAFWKRSPFFQRANAGLLPDGTVRVLLGSGDRDQIKDVGGGVCGLANLSACMRKNCSVTAQASKYRTGPSGSGHFSNSSWTYTAGALEPTGSFTYDTAGQNLACTDEVEANLDFTLSCGATTSTYSSDLFCDWGSSSGVDCPDTTGRPMNTKINYTPAITMTYSRFYSIKLFDSSTRAPFTSAAQALAYDTAALTETDLIDASSATASVTGNGWWLNHPNSVDERTSSSGLLLAGCVLWNTLQPNPSAATGCNNTLPLDTAYAYQADAITGAIACGSAGSASAAATVRSVSRSIYVAPQQPAALVSINPATGEIAYGSASVDPGAPPSSTQVGLSELWGTIHRLEIPRKLHDCRHNGTNCQ